MIMQARSQLEENQGTCLGKNFEKKFFLEIHFLKNILKIWSLILFNSFSQVVSCFVCSLFNYPLVTLA